MAVALVVHVVVVVVGVVVVGVVVVVVVLGLPFLVTRNVRTLRH